jgi:hypothetical protein
MARAQNFDDTITCCLRLARRVEDDEAQATLELITHQFEDTADALSCGGIVDAASEAYACLARARWCFEWAHKDLDPIDAVILNLLGNAFLEVAGTLQGDAAGAIRS